MPLIPMLDRKLLRDLWRIKGQALAIGVVIAAGVAVYVTMLSTYQSLEQTRATYYDRYRFGDVFAMNKRAPLRLAEDIRDIPGVARVEARVVVDVTIDLEDLEEPATGRLISIPAHRRPELCDVFLVEGRYIEPGKTDEALVNETFAREHDLRPGDTVAAIINGRRRELRIVGLALSPEYVYNIRPGDFMPDDVRFGIFWMERQALAAAFQMEGGFNSVVLRLMPGTEEREVMDRLDRILEPYGGLGSIPRRLQTSNWYLESELTQLEVFGSIVPVLFLGVAAFLLNVTLTRIVSVQREQIAVIKALGYSNWSVAGHYIKWGLAISLAGAAAGIVVGTWLGRAMTEMYASFYHFPLLIYKLNPDVIVRAGAISMVAATVGGLVSVWRAVQLPPAEAMRPEPPAKYQESWLERIGIKRLLSQPGRILLRSIERRPVRAMIGVVGIAAAESLLILGTFSKGAVDELMDYQFNFAQRYDVMVSFVEPVSAGALHEVRRLPGVIAAEPFRAVPVRLRSGHRQRDLAINGVLDGANLNRVVDTSFEVIRMPADGLTISTKLAEILHVQPGDTLTVEVLEGRRPVRRVMVTRVVDDYMGTNAYMDLAALHRLMQEGDLLSGAYLHVDEAHVSELYQRLKRTPGVGGVLLKMAAIRSFEETFATMAATIRGIYTLFSGVIALGVVYNSARISLSERARELATLRVIGFTRGEVAFILLGELGLLTVLALPVGMVLGYGMVAGMVISLSTEVWRFPLVILPETYAAAAITIVVAAALSAWVVRRKLEKLDLIEALKIRE